ncbi:MAG: cobalamin-dependent protein [Actinomycetota bacterium]|jgi:methanogenic corrinoid protein MtbC1|nr:cobalamin-dependent protein [Actinomycetota bacterium]MDD5600256.1 cobalamin-dependent protein [Actinomycetota bacterium]
MNKDLVSTIADLNEQEALKIVKDRLSAGEDPLKIMEDARKGLEIVGERFASSEYFIPDLVYSGEIMKLITELVKPQLTREEETRKSGKIVFGTVRGDIHDIGKNIVTFMLDVNGFEVIDLGVDVPEQKFVDKIKESGASIVGLSGFLTLAFDSMKQTIRAIEDAGLRDSVKVMIGGGQISEEIRKYTGADAYGKDAMAGVTLAKKWTGVN